MLFRSRDRAVLAHIDAAVDAAAQMLREMAVNKPGNVRKKSGGGKNAVQKNGNPSGSRGSWYTEKLPGLRGSKRPPRASDGHVMKGEQDISCRRFGHDHPEWEEPSMRYIVHDDPEEGYIILNGKKMKITEADKYENTI